MNAPATPTGWADDRLCEAYQLIEAVLDQVHEESDARHSIKQALDLIETADCELEREGWAV